MLQIEESFETVATAPHYQERIPFKILTDSYDCFMTNWDTVAHPTFVAVIRSPAEWETVFPTTAINKRRTTGPAPEFYQKSIVLVIARSADSYSPQRFTIDAVTASGSFHAQHLRVYYRYTAPPPPSTATFTNLVCIEIPRATYIDTTFFENVARLQLWP